MGENQKVEIYLDVESQHRKKIRPRTYGADIHLVFPCVGVESQLFRRQRWDVEFPFHTSPKKIKKTVSLRVLKSPVRVQRKPR
jgi:hypothetical protein